jgi:hypothetical protein
MVSKIMSLEAELTAELPTRIEKVLITHGITLHAQRMRNTFRAITLASHRCRNRAKVLHPKLIEST